MGNNSSSRSRHQKRQQYPFCPKLDQAPPLDQPPGPPPYSSSFDSSTIAQPQPKFDFPLTESPVSVNASKFKNWAREDKARWLQTPMRKDTQEDALQMLCRYNTIVLVDDSLSMSQCGRWKQAAQAFADLADVAINYDTDGIDIHFIHSKLSGENMKGAQEILSLFDRVSPRENFTPLGTKLDELLRAYLANLELAHRRDPVGLNGIKPVNIIVITDGMPSDDPESIIVQAARRLDKLNVSPDQVGIQFVQIGNSTEATEFLMELDDAMSERYGTLRDIVDTTPYDLTGGNLPPETIIKILLGGVNKRQDRKEVK
ncbi:hypothetical protein H2248_006786 [Termitomyces sp. 'cryptogamus']|nr:hypothetical protein H2248_006786 [Termitomyces sp. 'cryptogamus']